MEDFKKSKEAQEKYHDWEVANGYARRHTDELYSRLKNKFPELSYKDFRLIAHLRPGSLDDLLSGKHTLDDRPTKNNKTYRNYIKTANS